MITSMTGFAQGEAEVSGILLRWEVRAVNHRYLDIQFRLPEDYRVLEARLREATQKRLSRGKVEAQLRYVTASAQGDIHIDVGRLEALKNAIDQTERAWGSLNTPDPLEVLQFPGVLCEVKPDADALHEGALRAFELALDDLVEARQREGARLQEVLEERCQALIEQVGRVEKRLPEVRDGWLQRLRERCAQLAVEVDSDRLEQEVALIAQRADVDEELVRLRGHVEEIQSVLKRKEAVGRRLDFLMQELNREANTLSSKSQDSELTRAAVEMKVIIEQMREQVQNVE